MGAIARPFPYPILIVVTPKDIFFCSVVLGFGNCTGFLKFLLIKQLLTHSRISIISRSFVAAAGQKAEVKG